MKALRAVFAQAVFCSLYSIPLLSASVVAAEFPIATAAKHQQISLSAAFDATNKQVLVGILDSVNCPGKACVETPTAQLVSVATGALVGAPIGVTPKGGVPSVAFDGTNYLMVWKGADGSIPPVSSLYGQLVSASGSPVGASFVIRPAAKLGEDHDLVRLLFDGLNYFVAWEDRSDPVAQETGKIYGQFVTPAGALLGEVLPVSDPGEEHGQVLPAIASDLTNIFVVWADGRSQRACAPTPEGTCYPSDIYGQLITRSSPGAEGSLDGGNIFLRYNTLPHDRPLSVASSGAGYFVLNQERNVFPGEKCPWYGCVWDVSGFFVSQDGTPINLPYSKYLFSNYHDNASPVVAWSGSKYLISWTERYGRTKIYVETTAYYPDRTWGGNFTLASPAGGKVPGAAVPLPLGDGNFFTLINRGKPGKVWSDIQAYSGRHVYGTLMANLREISVSDPPAISLVKKSFKVTDTVENSGLGASLPSRTAYLLSTTTNEKDAVERLQGARSVPAVQAGATNSGTVKVTIPSWAAAGTYYLLACANRDYNVGQVPDTDMGDDCAASVNTITIIKPKLVESDVTYTDITVPKSTSAKPPHSFTVTDTVTNMGPVPATATLTRYYISLKPDKDYTAILLAGSRSIRALPANSNPANQSTGTARLKLPLSKTDKFATYYLFACSNDSEKPENGPSNCAASAPPEISCSGCH